MSGSGDPVLVKHRSSASVSTGESKERRAPNRYLPRPSTERRVLASNYPGLRSREQGRYPALHTLALGCRRHGQHRSSFRDRLGRGRRCRRVRFWSGRGCRGGRGRSGAGGSGGRSGAGGGRRRRGGFLRGSRPSRRLEVGRGDVMRCAKWFVELRVLRKEQEKKKEMRR